MESPGFSEGSIKRGRSMLIWQCYEERAILRLTWHPSTNPKLFWMTAWLYELFSYFKAYFLNFLVVIYVSLDQNTLKLDNTEIKYAGQKNLLVQKIIQRFFQVSLVLFGYTTSLSNSTHLLTHWIHVITLIHLCSVSLNMLWMLSSRYCLALLWIINSFS